MIHIYIYIITHHLVGRDAHHIINPLVPSLRWPFALSPGHDVAAKEQKLSEEWRRDPGAKQGLETETVRAWEM